MAEMVGSSRRLPHRNSVIGGFFAVLRTGVSRLVRGHPTTRLHVEAWPDYLLRDIGLDRVSLEPSDPHAPDWLRR